ncbi:MAG: hypothetical protein R3D60_03300 [Paracoccaceae bacterium]
MDEGVPCATIGREFDDGIVRDAHIWIKTNIDDATMRICIGEEFFNSMGIDEGNDFATSFDWLEHVPEGFAETDRALSGFHRLLLRTLYRGPFAPGQSIEITLRDASSLLD